MVELRQLFVRLGTTVLAVTHDQGEAFALSDRVVVMDAGRVAQVGTAQEVWSRPGSAFVARFLGFENVVAAEVRGEVAVTPWGPVTVPAGTPQGAGQLLVRPNGFELDDAGPLKATVRARTFRGDHVALLLDPEAGPPLEATCRLADAPEPGAVVRLRIDPAEVVSLPELTWPGRRWRGGPRAQARISWTKHQRHSSPGSADCITAWLVSLKCALAWRPGEESQQPM